MNFPEPFRLRDQDIQYPFDIPYQLQHAILATAQNILEKCCYDFARQWFPLELENAKWDCAEALELTKWTRLILKQSERLPSDAFATERTISQDILMSVHLLRHTAVHRLRTTARGVSKLIRYAITLTEALKYPVRTLQLEDLLREVEAEIKDKDDREYALDEGITAILQNQLDGIVPQGNECSIEEEITALFEMLPPSPELQAERQGSDDRI
jgi:hypothetical protein